MHTALFAIIIANIVYAFDLSMPFNRNIYKKLDLSTAIVTYVEIKDIHSLKSPVYTHTYRMRNFGNSLVSPIVMDMITALLLNVLKNSSKKELITYLIRNKVGKIPLSDMYKSEFSYLNDIENIELYFGNAIYVQKSVNLTNNFISLCMKKKLHCSKVDFKNNVQTARIINSWVEEKTNDKLPHVIFPDVDINKDTKIMLINVAYFHIGLDNIKAKISEKRKYYVTPSKLFYVPTIQIENLSFIYGEVPYWNAKFVEIPVSNANITINIFYPIEKGSEGLEYMLNKLDFDEFKLIKNVYTNKFENIDYLILPRFTIEYHENMTTFYYQNGVTTMFKNDADLTGLSKIPLKVNNIFQTNFIYINLGNLEAPNVNENKVREPADSQKQLIIDCPFYYAINVHGEVAFAGVMQAPEFLFRGYRKDEL
ncbi:antitrypsin-like isoform X2 [Cataglyphis hispanica]|uniref:antitrypsin-like isoform X2 n=1 Tax=Cataglyphis hispanica TaxID=1086592 RepID=UPI00217FDD51|nr:antitrypsin-like isoform X2 [Cataglyphis hispanica]